jgi:hypothetical protein
MSTVAELLGDGRFRVGPGQSVNVNVTRVGILRAPPC